jgi:hypothetical protein
MRAGRSWARDGSAASIETTEARIATNAVRRSQFKFAAATFADIAQRGCIQLTLGFKRTKSRRPGARGLK